MSLDALFLVLSMFHRGGLLFSDTVIEVGHFIWQTSTDVIGEPRKQLGEQFDTNPSLWIWHSFQILVAFFAWKGGSKICKSRSGLAFRIVKIENAQTKSWKMTKSGSWEQFDLEFLFTWDCSFVKSICEFLKRLHVLWGTFSIFVCDITRNKNSTQWFCENFFYEKQKYHEN